MWAGDVGQEDREEVNLVVPGGNRGWKVLEGELCQAPDGALGCDLPNHVAPVHTYDHAEGSSVTGGLFYTGSALPLLRDSYLFADFA